MNAPFGMPSLFGELTQARLKVESKSGQVWKESKWGMELCYKGGLILQQGQYGGDAGLRDGEAVNLFVGQDGSLIATGEKMNMGIILFIPVAVSKSSYFQFPKVEGEANK